MDSVLQNLQQFRHAFNEFLTPRFGLGCSYSAHLDVFAQHKEPMLFHRDVLVKPIVGWFIGAASDSSAVQEYMDTQMLNPGNHIRNYGDVMILSFFACLLVKILSFLISPILFPQTYGKLMTKNERRDWDSRFVFLFFCFWRARKFWFSVFFFFSQSRFECSRNCLGHLLLSWIGYDPFFLWYERCCCHNDRNHRGISLFRFSSNAGFPPCYRSLTFFFHPLFLWIACLLSFFLWIELDWIELNQFFSFSLQFDKMTVLHHVCGFLGFSYAIRDLQFGNIVLIWIFTEITTPIVNQRWFFMMLNMKDSILYMLNGALMLLGFVIVRVGMNFVMAYLMWENRVILFRDTELIGHFTLFFLWFAEIVFNFYWTYLIAKGFFKLLCGKKSSSSSSNKNKTESSPSSSKKKSKKQE